MKVVAVDQDQVLADILSKWLYRYNNDYNDNLKIVDLTDWDMTKFVKPECGKKIYNYLNYDLFRNLDVIKDSQECIRHIMDQYEVFITTTATSYPEALVAKIEWLQEHFPFISRNNIVLCGSKKIIKADYMIDDGIHNLEAFCGEGLLFDAPHNQHENNFKRFKDWNEIVNYLM